MKVYALRLAILLAAFLIGIICYIAFHNPSIRCLKLDPPDSQIQIIAKGTGKAFWVKTCPR
jgi:hypothetical protein